MNKLNETETTEVKKVSELEHFKNELNKYLFDIQAMLSFAFFMLVLIVLFITLSYFF